VNSYPPIEHIKMGFIVLKTGQDFSKIGDMYYNTDLQELMIFDGNKWLSASGGTIRRATFGGPVVRELDL